MIVKDMKSYSLYKKSIGGVDEYGQPSPPSFVKTVDVSIYIKEHHTNEDDIRFNEVTHIGLTKETNIESGMMLDNKYIIQYVVNGGRYRMLYLKEM